MSAFDLNRRLLSVPGSHAREQNKQSEETADTLLKRAVFAADDLRIILRDLEKSTPKGETRSLMLVTSIWRSLSAEQQDKLLAYGRALARET